MNHSIVLDRNSFARLQGPRRLRVTHGTVWLTIDHDPDDHVLTHGQGIDLPAGAQALLQALDAPARTCVEQGEAWWQRALRGTPSRVRA